MNQDFTVKKSNICLTKKFVQRGSPEKKKQNKIPAQAVSEKKNSYKLKIPHPPLPPPQWSNGPSLMMKLSSTYTQYFIFTFLMFYVALMY